MYWSYYHHYVARQQEIEAEEEKKQYAELAHLAMLLGFPGAMIDEGMSSLVNSKKKSTAEVRHTNVCHISVHFIWTCYLSVSILSQLVNLTSDSKEATSEPQEGNKQVVKLINTMFFCLTLTEVKEATPEKRKVSITSVVKFSIYSMYSPTLQALPVQTPQVSTMFH